MSSLASKEPLTGRNIGIVLNSPASITCLRHFGGVSGGLSSDHELVRFGGVEKVIFFLKRRYADEVIMICVNQFLMAAILFYVRIFGKSARFFR